MSKEGLGEKYFNEPKFWKKTEKSVRDALNEAKFKLSLKLKVKQHFMGLK